MERLIEIESDCLCVVQRIKAIDSDYYVVFDLDEKKFKLFCRGQFGNPYCLTFPYDRLDERCVDYVLRTRVQNSDKIFEEIEKENELNTKRQIKQILNGLEERIYDS